MSLRRIDIEKYKSSATERDKNALEISVSDDSFENDALEGWSNPLLKSEQLKKLDRKFKKINAKNLKNYVIILSALIFVIFGVFLYTENKDHDNTKNKKVTARQVLEKRKAFNNNQNGEHKIIEQPIIKPKIIGRDFHSKLSFDSIEQSKSETNQFELTRLPINKAIKIEAKKENRSNNGIETYIQNLKVIDYRYYRGKPLNKTTLPLTGTSADHELIKPQQNSENSIIEISYVNYLEKSLKLFSSGLFRKALFRFDYILEKYPNDVNALFYGALCNFNLKEFDTCEKKLLLLENSTFTNFNQEQQWYLLLTFKAQGKTELARKTRDSILRQNGFYSKRALELNL